MSAQNSRKKYDIVVGIPSYNEADNISFVAETVSDGLKKHFPDCSSIIVNVDNASPDGTKEAFLNADTAFDKKYISTKPGIKGKGNNLYNLFNFAKGVQPKVIVMVDADLKSITKEWIKRLVGPVLNGYDYVIPIYSRHQFDATITNHICYPAMFGMLSFDIRQPIGGDFAFSPALMNHWLEQEWTDNIRNYGIDIFMTLNAVLGGFRICQAALGKKMHKPSAPKVGDMFEQVIITMLDILMANRDAWLKKCPENIKAPDTFGLDTLPEPDEAELDVRALKAVCHKEFNKYRDSIEEHLEPYTFGRVCEMFERDVYDMDILLWTQIFYTLLNRYDKAGKESDKKKIINTMKPLYFARSLSFNYDTWKFNVKYAEMEVRKQALGFSSQRYYLLGLYEC